MFGGYGGQVGGLGCVSRVKGGWGGQQGYRRVGTGTAAAAHVRRSPVEVKEGHEGPF